MVSPRPKTKLTYEDYAKTPDDERWELIDGELFRMLSPNIAHQMISGELFPRMKQFVQERDLGIVFHAPNRCCAVGHGHCGAGPVVHLNGTYGHHHPSQHPGRAGLGGGNSPPVHDPTRPDGQARRYTPGAALKSIGRWTPKPEPCEFSCYEATISWKQESTGKAMS